MRTIVYILLTLILLALIPIVANWIRRRVRRQERRERGFDQLQRLADQHGFDPSENRTIERMAEFSTANPAQVLGSHVAFDGAVKSYVERLMKRPWLEMEDEIRRLAAIREKLGFRYIAEDRRPHSTRHLFVGQKIYILARGQKGFRLLSAEILDLNDLAIYTEPFKEDGHIVRFRNRHQIWAFFWSPYGGECRFKTQVFREYERPSPYLMLEHGDELIYNEDRKIFSCDLDIALTVTRLPASIYGRHIPSAELFDAYEDLEEVPVKLVELSASGLVIDSPVAFAENDLIRIHPSDEDPNFLDGWTARARWVEGSNIRFRFLQKSRERLETILRFITPRVSNDALKDKARRSTVTQT